MSLIQKYNCKNNDQVLESEKNSRATIPLSGCVLEHIFCSQNLSNLEKIYYILVNSLSFVNSCKGKEEAIALSAKSWSKKLNCSKGQVFNMQKDLERKGYFILSKSKNNCGQSNRNSICPTLPKNVFQELLENSKDKINIDNNLTIFNESKLQCLSRRKLFILIDYQYLRNIASSDLLNPFNKILLLDFYTRCYKTQVYNLGTIKIDSSENSYFVSSYYDLENKYSCKKSMISGSLKILEQLGLIKKKKFYIKKYKSSESRQDKCLWQISTARYSNNVFNFNSNLKTINYRKKKSENFSNTSFLSSKVKDNKTNVKLNDPEIIFYDLHNNKNLKNKNITNTNIDKKGEFNIYNMVIQKSYESIPKDKIEKAKKFACSLFYKKPNLKYLLSISRKELINQLVFHTASWKPSKISASNNKKIDIALTFAWDAIVKGTWKEPRKLSEARELHNQFLNYQREYKNLGKINNNIKLLETKINTLLDSKYCLSLILKQDEQQSQKDVARISSNSWIQKKELISVDSNLLNSNNLSKKRGLTCIKDVLRDIMISIKENPT